VPAGGPGRGAAGTGRLRVTGAARTGLQSGAGGDCPGGERIDDPVPPAGHHRARHPAIGVSRPLQFQPGTNWAYSHTNYAILGRLLEIITGRPLAQVIQRYIIGPMGLANTSNSDGTPAIPELVLHTYSSERRSALQIPPSVPFTEDTTFWNPSWTTATGAVQTTNIYDMATSMRLVGDGHFVSPAMYRAQTGPNLVGFGHRDLSGRCPACDENTAARSYGLGVVLRGPWITRTKNFYGNGATAGYLPTQDLTIAVSVTYNPQAFDSTGGYANANPSASIFTAIAAALAPNQTPPGS
jgi:CubicO group peptidase (beta-lactamase class C family)